MSKPIFIIRLPGYWTSKQVTASREAIHGRKDLQMFYNISAEFAYSLDRRSIADRAESTVFSSIPDAVLVSGQITGQPAKLEEKRH